MCQVSLLFSAAYKTVSRVTDNVTVSYHDLGGNQTQY